MSATKLEMARIVTQALHNASEMPKADNWKVKRFMRLSKSELAGYYKTAKTILSI